MATRTSTSRSRSGGTGTTTARKRSTAAKTGAAKTTRSRTTRAKAQSVTDEAKTVIRSARTRATRAVKKVPTDRTSLTIAAGVVAGIVAAGFAIFMNRDKLRSAATTGSEKLRSAATSGGEKLRKAADDLSHVAHDRLEQARDNISKFRSRANGSTTSQTPSVETRAAANG